MIRPEHPLLVDTLRSTGRLYTTDAAKLPHGDIGKGDVTGADTLKKRIEPILMEGEAGGAGEAGILDHANPCLWASQPCITLIGGRYRDALVALNGPFGNRCFSRKEIDDNRNGGQQRNHADHATDHQKTLTPTFLFTCLAAFGNP